MKRTWATGSAHDDKPLDWLFDLRHASDVSHMANVIEEISKSEGLEQRPKASAKIPS